MSVTRGRLIFLSSALAITVALSGCVGTGAGETSTLSQDGSSISSEVNSSGSEQGGGGQEGTPEDNGNSVSISGEAVEVVKSLTVKGRAPKTGYAREQFGSGWTDVDRNGCNTRDDMLRRDLLAVSPEGGCEVEYGILVDPYGGENIEYIRGKSLVDIDHVVALSDAWQKGAFQWSYAKRVAFANDPGNLLSVSASLNRQKGDADAATWLPPAKAYRCEYVARQAAVKAKYGVWVTDSEQEAMLVVLAACPGQEVPDLGGSPVEAPNVSGEGPSVPAVPSPQRPTTGGLKNYGTCAAAKAAGEGPYRKGVDPQYEYYRDADGDGLVCE